MRYLLTSIVVFVIITGGCRKEQNAGGVPKGDEPAKNNSLDGEPSAASHAIQPDSSNRAEQTGTTFLYVRIPDKIMPVERGSKYEDPLNEALDNAGLGQVSGGGTMMNKDKSIEYVGIDIDVTNPDTAIPIIVDTLRKAKAPKGTVIEQYEPKRIDHPVW